GTATMAFINDNQVKKVAWVFFIESWAIRILCDSLIGRKVYFASFVGYTILNFPTCISKVSKHFIFGIINQNISIGKIEDLRVSMLATTVPARLPELPANLEGNECFACAGCHGEQNTFRFVVDNFLDGAIDGNFLVITRNF